MTWKTLEEASKNTPKRTLQRHIQKQEIPAYLCPETGRRMVWINEPAEIAHRREREKWAEVITQLSSEVSQLGANMAQLTATVAQLAANMASTPAPTRRAKVAPPKNTKKRAIQSRPMPATQLQLLEWVKNSWSKSERELERLVGLPHGFLNKARKGLRSGPRSCESWRKLQSFIQEYKLEAA